ncbi:MAG: response regulator [Anaerolineales bacterium]|nr:response regulator [Anaerolineales bacterium]
MNETPTILIVDDDAAARQTTEMLLLREGYTLAFAESGQAALSRLARPAPDAGLPDVILLDVMMPGMDGLAVCRRLKENDAWQHIPVILVTALDAKEDLAAGLAAGADDFVHKPVSGLELRARVRSMLRIKQRHDALQAAMQLRQDLSHMIMHDIRAPLATMSVYCDLLQHSVSPDEAELVHVITNQIDRLSGFVNDMLMLAKMEHGSLVLLREPVKINELIRSVIETHQPFALQRGIEFNLDLPAGAPQRPLDASLWQRMLDNLVANALKFSPPGATVRLCAELRGAEGLRLRVIDEGPGIPAEFRETIFDKYRIVAAGRRDVQQVGLGLAFCRMVVEAHHGRIFVTPNEPRGAIFTIEL